MRPGSDGLSDDLIIAGLAQFITLHDAPGHHRDMPASVETLQSRWCGNSQQGRNTWGLIVDDLKNVRPVFVQYRRKLFREFVISRAWGLLHVAPPHLYRVRLA